MATAFDWKKLSQTEKVISVTGLIALIGLFLPWFSISTPLGSESWDGFSAGWGWLGALLIVAAAVYIVLLRSGSQMPKFSYGPGVIVLGLSALGALIVILRWLTIGHGSGTYAGESWGPSFGLYLVLIAGIVQAFFALRLFRASGEAVPWANRNN
jgi:hypothetical protein